MISVIIPAYNEGRVIGRLLGRLVASAHPGELDVIVVANGCTDDTVAVATAFGPPVRVLSIASASKPQALTAGDQAARGFPRVYLDADVEIGAEDLRAMEKELQRARHTRHRPRARVRDGRTLMGCPLVLRCLDPPA